MFDLAYNNSDGGFDGAGVLSALLDRIVLPLPLLLVLLINLVLIGLEPGSGAV